MILVGTAQPTVLSNTRVIPSVVPSRMLLVEYSGGDDILASPRTDGDIPRGNVTQVISGLTDPWI